MTQETKQELIAKLIKHQRYFRQWLETLGDNPAGLVTSASWLAEQEAIYQQISNLAHEEQWPGYKPAMKSEVTAYTGNDYDTDINTKNT